MNTLYCLAAMAVLAACGEGNAPIGDADAIDDCFVCTTGPADQMGMTAYEVSGVLDLVNMASRRELDEDVALDARAANNIVDQRIANGGFTSLELLDDVAYVGKKSFKRLRDYAFDHGWVGACGDAKVQGRVESCDDGNKVSGDGCSRSCKVEGSVRVHGYAEGSLEAIEILDIANTASLLELDNDARLDSRAAKAIVNGRPFGSLSQLDMASYVGANAFDAMLAFAAVRVRCDDGTLDQLIVDVNGTSWASGSTREIRTDRTLDWALDARNWPNNMTHAGCFGIDPADVPSWVPVTSAEDNTRLKELVKSFGESAERRGTSIEVDTAVDEVECRTPNTEFIGCRFEFEPSPHGGINWSILSATDGSIELMFVGTWAY